MTLLLSVVGGPLVFGLGVVGYALAIAYNAATFTETVSAICGIAREQVQMRHVTSADQGASSRN